MTDDELIAAAKDARQNAHSAWKNTDGNRPSDWSGSSRHFEALWAEAKRRGVDISKILGPGDVD
jgi:hypothetical protein